MDPNCAPNEAFNGWWFAGWMPTNQGPRDEQFVLLFRLHRILCCILLPSGFLVRTNSHWTTHLVWHTHIMTSISYSTMWQSSIAHRFCTKCTTLEILVQLRVQTSSLKSPWWSEANPQHPNLNAQWHTIAAGVWSCLGAPPFHARKSLWRILSRKRFFWQWPYILASTCNSLAVTSPRNKKWQPKIHVILHSMLFIWITQDCTTMVSEVSEGLSLTYLHQACRKL